MKINWFKINKKIINSEISDLLIYLYLEDYGKFYDIYYIFLTYLNQGKFCKDCNNYIDLCRCCFFQDETPQEAEKIIYKFIKYNLSNKIKQILTNILKNKSDIINIEYAIEKLKENLK